MGSWWNDGTSFGGRKTSRCREDFTCCVNGGRRANVMMEICHSGLFGSIGEQKK
jgi:hypothetical protein